MSIIYKLTLSLFALSLVVFGVYGTYQLQSETKSLRDEVEQETRLLAYSLLIAVENALRDHQTDDVQALLQQLERLEPSIDVRIYIQNSDVIRSDAESLAWPEAIEQSLYQAAIDGTRQQLYFPVNNPELIILTLPFTVPANSLRGNLAVVRSLQVMNTELEIAKTYILISLIAFILSTSLLCFLLGHFYISRPLHKLGLAMRTFRNSEAPPVAIAVNGNDELAAVTREFNLMTNELFTAYRQLEAETLHRRQLQRALQDADKLITLGHMTAGLAHEIGSPLQIVNGRARALARCHEDAEEVQRIASILVDQTDRITRIVQRLLEFTPAPAAATTMPCDVIAAIAEVIDMLGFEARRQAVSMTFTHPDSLPLIALNKDSIQQIVLNLLTNALAAMTGQGKINIELSLSSIDYAQQRLPALKLLVSDTGAGIAPEHFHLIFEPYFTTRKQHGGTGLGLAVIKTLLADMGGSIIAESTPDKGSQFIIHFPYKLPT